MVTLLELVGFKEGLRVVGTGYHVGGGVCPEQLPLDTVTSSIAMSPVKEYPTVPSNVNCKSKDRFLRLIYLDVEVREKDNTPPVAKFLVEIDLNRYCQKIRNFFLENCC